MYELIVVGGGPSGSSAARRAGKLGIDTLLIEKQTFPRYKPCGGAISEQALSYLDFKIPEQLQERNVFGARVHFNGQILEQQKEYRIATLITRSVFDSYLMQKAEETNIKVNYSENVLGITEKETHVEVITNKGNYQAVFVIIAEGSGGKLKSRIRRKDTKNEFGVCAVTELPASNETIDNYIRNSIDIHFGVANLGYGWVFPHEKHFSVGVGGVAADMTNPQKILNEFLLSNGFVNFDPNNFKVHTIPAGGIKRKTYGGRTILVGDSGGYVDSFYGEGIAYAIRSGQIAAEVVFENLKYRRAGLQEYARRCQREFGSNLKYSLVLSKLMHKIPSIFFTIFTSQEIVLNKYLDVPAVKTTYKEYIRWLLPRVPKYLFAKPKQ